MITVKKKYIIALFILLVGAIVGVIMWTNYQKKVDMLNAQTSEMVERMNYPWRYNKIDSPEKYFEAIRQINASNLSEIEKQKEKEDVQKRQYYER